ncbi:MAG: hypothetical protein KGI79_00145 [Patescibacteria group bacterium]|nr:hypothetical protein [Patescibacteria group bacterium]MDE2116281.1 hypothetical protein [Patescibacteria group bacterium]
MDRKALIMIGLFVGSSVGSFIPSLWGASVLSFSSLILGALGALGGIWVAFRLSA